MSVHSLMISCFSLKKTFRCGIRKNKNQTNIRSVRRKRTASQTLSRVAPCGWTLYCCCGSPRALLLLLLLLPPYFLLRPLIMSNDFFVHFIAPLAYLFSRQGACGGGVNHVGDDGGLHGWYKRLQSFPGMLPQSPLFAPVSIRPPPPTTKSAEQ